MAFAGLLLSASAPPVLPQCAPSTAKTDLDANNVRATLLAGGDMWWDLANPGYEVPINSGKHSLYTGSVWFGGIDANNQIYTAAQTYRQTGNDFWPGPMDTTNQSITSSACLNYNKHWVITRQEVSIFAGGGPATNVISTWPGNGNAALNQGHYLAPFVDVNNDGIYNHTAGDYPGFDLTASYANCCNYLNGDKAVWWIINDVGNIHTETLSPSPFGLEIHCQAFAFNAPEPAIDNSTFYQYKIINRSATAYLNMFMGMWVDADLGNYLDDYVGCDVVRGLGYCYNGDPLDDGSAGYGQNPPAVGVDILQGPAADLADGVDNDRDGCVDCTFIIQGGNPVAVSDTVQPEYWQMSRFLSYNNVNNTPNGNPDGYADFYNYLHAIWLDGLPLTYGDDGRDPNNLVCHFMYPGMTDPLFPSQNWTELTVVNAPGDRRFLMSAGPYTLEPGEVNCVSVAVVWAHDLAWANGGITALQAADDKVQALFDACFDPAVLSVSETPPSWQITVSPNPFSGHAYIIVDRGVTKTANLVIYNTAGQPVKTQMLHRGQNRIEQGNTPAGVYFYRVTDEKGVVAKGKLMML
jgi:hypothetical protein